MRYSDDELLDDVTTIAEELSDPPTLAEFRKYSEHSATTYYERFGSWNEALQAAGFEPRDATSKIPQEDLLAELEHLAAEFGESPSAQQMNGEGEYWASTYRNRFGSWNAALKAADLEVVSPSTEVSEADLLAELQRLADELGETPTFSLMSEQGEFAPRTYVRHFGSWNAAVEAADLEPRTTGAEVTSDELLMEIQRLAEILGEKPSSRDMAEKGTYGVATYQRHFGSWSAAVEAALSEENEE